MARHPRRCPTPIPSRERAKLATSPRKRAESEGQERLSALDVRANPHSRQTASDPAALATTYPSD